jgi:hypothetical protein
LQRRATKQRQQNAGIQSSIHNQHPISALLLKSSPSVWSTPGPLHHK